MYVGTAAITLLEILCYFVVCICIIFISSHNKISTDNWNNLLIKEEKTGMATTTNKWV